MAADYPIAGELEYGPDDCIVEIGCERGGGSTGYFRKLAEASGIPFFTVDADPDHPGGPIVARGEDWLFDVFPTLGLNIRFAYLDAFDWTWAGREQEPHIAAQRQRYAELGLTMTNENSQLTHLALSRLVHFQRARACTILLDDTWWVESGAWDGKGGLAIPWLVGHGYRVTPIGGFHGSVRVDR